MKRIKFNKYAGIKIKGKKETKLDTDGNGLITPIEKALWLTAMVESNGVYGSVMNYDGTGITAGIHQAVAVYPKNLKVQGSLWGLLRDIQLVLSTPEQYATEAKLTYMALQEMFMDENVELTADGVLRYMGTGNALSGYHIRDLLTGSYDGVMPKIGKNRVRAENFVLKFHKLFSNPTTFQVQNKYGLKHFAKLVNRRMRFSKKFSKCTIDQFVYKRLYKSNSLLCTKEDQASDAVDLAMAMFWSHSVNSPGQALRIFCKAANLASSDPTKDEDGYQFAKNLIRYLGTSSYGRWDDNLKNGRYQRTRKYAKKIFNAGLFKGSNPIMPKQF